MTAVIPRAGAVSHADVDWKTIDWRKVHTNVRRLQARIVKATQEGRWGKVKALQRLLTHSFSGKALAIRRVTENQGKRTPGCDGVIWTGSLEKATALESLRQRGYTAKPLRRIHIPKSNGKRRPLSIPCMKDRAMQALYLLALDPIAETRADPNSYGFRRERSTADAIAQCFTVLATNRAPRWILEGDIRACFDGISHEWLMAHVPMDTPILKQWLKAGFMERHVLHSTPEGVPQGGIASPVLANLALDGLERRLFERFPKTTRRYRQAKINFCRYADDFIITGSSYELLEHEVKPLVEDFLKERGLELSKEKTRITNIEDGFDFLGQNIRKYKNKLLIKPARKNISAFLTKIREIVKANKQAKTGNLIAQLNPVIRGWAAYHRHVVSKQVFNAVDAAIFKIVWRWAKRRHPNWSRSRIVRTYFRSEGSRHWVFHGKTRGRSGSPRDLSLVRAVDTPIRRHIKVTGTANPYDPAWELYFERRLDVRMEGNLQGRATLLYLWKQQHGICPICSEKITKLTGWHSHHITWRSHGGSDGARNRVLLHPACHAKAHSLGYTVVKPRSKKSV